MDLHGHFRDIQLYLQDMDIEVLKFHKGIDIPASAGTTIVAAGSGTVEWANYSTTAGNWIGINHGNGVYSVYMHMFCTF